jgi:DNA-binding Xre family transcriptional regulator
MVMLREIGVDLAGKEVVVVGRSNIVGKPVALMCLQQHATVTICHSKTRDLAAKVGMSGPNISRIETQPAQNLTLGTLIRMSDALNCRVAITLKPRRNPSRKPRPS